MAMTTAMPMASSSVSVGGEGAVRMTVRTLAAYVGAEVTLTATPAVVSIEVADAALEREGERFATTADAPA